MKKAAISDPNASKNSSYGHLLHYFEILKKKLFLKTVTIYSSKAFKTISRRENKTRESDLSFFFLIKKY